MGTSEINVPPDEVVLSFVIQSREKTLGEAKAQNDQRAKKVIALSHAAGVEQRDIQTSTLQMGPYYSEEKVPRLLGYKVWQDLTITSRTDPPKYESIMTRLLESGVDRVDDIDFRVAETRKLRDDARIKAIRAAKEKATAMASELGQTIGKPWSISEGGGINGLVNLTTKSNSSYSYAGGGEDQSTVAPGQVTISATVSEGSELQ